MTQPYKKKLIEVAIPLEAINAASAREKSIRHGHPSTLHLWWARRPLAACRAVLFAQLVDDPSSHPDQFPTHEDQERERQRLFAIIEDLVKWESSTNEEVLERARAEIRRSCGGVLPPVYDPFSGGGSIPLEAQRLGLPAYGSDLNPVAVMIGKAMIEIPPKFKDMPPIHPGIKERSFYRNAEGLAEDVKYYGEWMREKAWERIGHLYPQVDLPKEHGGGKATVAAWIWARTVPSPDPAFSESHVPIASSFLLSPMKGKEAWIEPIVDRSAGTIHYEVRRSGNPEQIAKASEGAKAGRGANFHCLLSGSAITPEYVKRMGREGKIGKVLIAIVAESKSGRTYYSPSEADRRIATELHVEWKPEINLPNHSQYIGVLGYGFKTFGDLFTERQLVALNTFVDLAIEAKEKILSDAIAAATVNDDCGINDGGRGARAYSEAVAMYLSFLVSKLADKGSTLCTWDPGPASNKTATGRSARAATVRVTFSRQALQMTWDFAEVNFFSSSVGAIETVLKTLCAPLLYVPPLGAEGRVDQRDAQSSIVPAGGVISTDPPYYDNIPYADLSDYFYAWMRRSLGKTFPELTSTFAVPKLEELVADRMRHKGSENAEIFFLSGMKAAMSRLSSQITDEFPTTIYYAFKQSEILAEGISSTGWATFLQAVIEAGYSVVGTWPVRTELSNRMRGIGSNALANSVVLVCRKKEASAEVITRAEFIRALKRELPPAIAELQAANIAPADMPQSAIGPGMGVFSRYKAVLESDDSPMTVKAALQLINRELDEYLGGIQGEFDADTRFAITWFEQNGLKAGDYGTANNIATARGISVESVKHAGIVESAAGKVRILKRDEMDAEWEPDADGHLTVWECCQHLVRLHEKYGIGYEAAVMLKKFGPKADDVRDLAYVLYNICEKRGDAKEATAYNALIADWTDLTREAATAPLTNRSGQMRFEV
jgi:putative DNA methylase